MVVDSTSRDFNNICHVIELARSGAKSILGNVRATLTNSPIQYKSKGVPTGGGWLRGDAFPRLAGVAPQCAPR